MKYDFILFENAYHLENHYLDLELLAILLQRAGYNVAIANVFKEEKLCKNAKIPHINLKYKPYKYFRELSTYRNSISNLRYSFLRLLCNLYLIYSVFILSKKTKRIYLGSLTIDTPILWMILLPFRCDFYIWGLRSYVIQKWKEKILSRYGLYSLLLYCIIKFYTRVKIIVSNSIISGEFKEIINNPNSRILVRPERWVFDDYLLPHRYREKEKLTFLTIGTLRRTKHVELVLDAFRKCKYTNYEYIIAGRCKDDNGYNEMIEEKAKGLIQVKRLNRFIPDEEYNSLLKSVDFVILCDEKEKSCGTNGTMMEALLQGIPIIAPKHEPFISEIQKNGVGLLYDMYDIPTLTDCIEELCYRRNINFYDNIKSYIERYKENNIVNHIKQQISYNENN